MDPDNRHPVDFEARKQMAAELREAAEGTGRRWYPGLPAILATEGSSSTLRVAR